MASNLDRYRQDLARLIGLGDKLALRIGLEAHCITGGEMNAKATEAFKNPEVSL